MNWLEHRCGAAAVIRRTINAWHRAEQRRLAPAQCCPHCGEPLPAASTDGKPGRVCPACGEPLQEAA